MLYPFAMAKFNLHPLLFFLALFITNAPLVATSLTNNATHTRLNRLSLLQMAAIGSPYTFAGEDVLSRAGAVAVFPEEVATQWSPVLYVSNVSPATSA